MALSDMLANRRSSLTKFATLQSGQALLQRADVDRGRQQRQQQHQQAGL